MRALTIAVILLGGLLPGLGLQAATLDLGAAKLVLDDSSGAASLAFADGAEWGSSGQPAFGLRVGDDVFLPQTVRLEGDRLAVGFQGGAKAQFRVTLQRGVAVFRLLRLDAPKKPDALHLFRLAVPEGAQVLGTLNGARAGRNAAAVMGAEVNVRAFAESPAGARGDRQGCSHQLVRTEQAKVGGFAARFTATCDEKPGGWSVRGKTLARPLDLSGCKAIRAWVHGDGQGEALKIQLYDGAGGYRDNYLTIDFTGWRRVTLVDPPLDTLRYDRVAAVNFYYNGTPAGKTVTCLLDQVEAVLVRGGVEQVVVLEDFESARSPLFSPPGTTLALETVQAHGLEPAAFGVIACPQDEFWQAVERFEHAAGVPSPRPGGAWNKRSPWIKRSYFFLTSFGESQLDQALAIARRGGFHTILLGQESWCTATGHFDVDRRQFPDGLDGLKRTVSRLKEAGFRVGFHFLGPSIYPPDAYLTPVPDPRLVKGATAELGADVDAKAAFLPIVAAPEKFPAEDGGYEGDGTVLQVGDELIAYGSRSMKPPYGFAECRRGHLGTRPAAHRKGDRVAHLVRSYGYHMFDMDTSLLDEVAAHFARVANACRIDMIYFDGSERLQGDHWYYNARLHKAFYDKLDNKDMLLQASSFSHYSWHLLARSASADGHGDLKGYLDERSPGFDWLAAEGMPLDIGWYYGYDPAATPDMFEYVLGATIGYDSSMSFQVSVDAAAAHPFTGEVLDLIARYEKLRLSGRVTAAMKARLRIDPALGGVKKPDERARLLDQRREYRLLRVEGQDVFQRVAYGAWQEVKPLDAARGAWQAAVREGPARVGFQLHVQPGPWLAPGPAYRSPDALTLETFDELAPYAADPKGRRNVRSLGPGEAGSVSPGVTQRIELREDGAREGKRYALYTAASSQARAEGWSVLGKSFDPPLDLSWHRGIGFWLRGDGKGGQFKLQLRDDKGATDYYVANDYPGWRYQQLARPEKDPINYRRVRGLMFYHNGLPAKTEVSCAIDDVKALRGLDRQAVADPWVEIGGKRLGWKGTLGEGQYVVVWPGEPPARYGRPLKEPERSAEPAEGFALPAGTYDARFGCAGDLTAPVRVRLTFQPPERHPIP